MSRATTKHQSDDDTIVAIITPPGEGGIAALRLAGPLSLSLLSKFFRPHGAELSEPCPFMLRYGDFVDAQGEVVDEVTVVYMPHGRSYTGLEQVEIFCHGGRQVVRLILEDLLEAGARSAEPGEFTRLAFINGRIDLARAEAVAELIASHSKRSYRASKEHLIGAYSEHVNRLREDMVSVTAEIEAGIDFPEEEISTADQSELIARLDGLIAQLSALIATYSGGRIINEGFRVAIAGRPNAGKSSLFNLLLKHERALVNPIPGTTRDYLSEWVDLDGFAVNLIDTAGIREKGGTVERLGQDRARKIVGEADLTIWIVDLSKARWEQTLKQDVPRLKASAIVLLGNKLDIVKNRVARHRAKELGMLLLSCKTGAGVQSLEKELVARINSQMPDMTSGLVVTSARHKQKLSAALKSASSARARLEHGESPDLVAFDLRDATVALDEITGRVYTEQILDRIFARFCIGK